MTQFTKMETKYPGKCSICKGKIEVGDTILLAPKSPGKRWRWKAHLECSDKRQAEKRTVDIPERLHPIFTNFEYGNPIDEPSTKQLRLICSLTKTQVWREIGLTKSEAADIINEYNLALTKEQRRNGEGKRQPAKARNKLQENLEDLDNADRYGPLGWYLWKWDYGILTTKKGDPIMPEIKELQLYQDIDDLWDSAIDNSEQTAKLKGYEYVDRIERAETEDDCGHILKDLKAETFNTDKLEAKTFAKLEKIQAELDAVDFNPAEIEAA